MTKKISYLIFILFLVECGNNNEEEIFQNRIVGNWWRCKYISDNVVLYNHKDVSESNNILTFDGNIFNEYYIWDNENTLFMSWPYSFDGSYLYRQTKNGTSFVGDISYKNDSLILDRFANNANERMFFVKYEGELPPLSWPQHIMID